MDALDWTVLIPRYLKDGTFCEGIPYPTHKKVKDEAHLFEYDEQTELLQRQLKDETLVLVVPYVERADLLLRLHEEMGRHGQAGTYALVEAHMWWPSLHMDVYAIVCECRACQLIKRGTPGVAPLHPIPPAHPFERWGLDFISQLPKTKQGNCWIIAAIDYGTSWPIAHAMKEATAKNVALFLYEEIFLQFGMPSEIVSDRGANFMGHVLQQYLKKM